MCRYGFWSVKEAPYMLGGKIINHLDNGRMVIEGFHGYSFKVDFVLNEEEGEMLTTELDSLRIAKEKELYIVERKYDEKALELTGRVLANVAFYGKAGLKE